LYTVRSVGNLLLCQTATTKLLVWDWRARVWFPTGAVTFLFGTKPRLHRFEGAPNFLTLVPGTPPEVKRPEFQAEEASSVFGYTYIPIITLCHVMNIIFHWLVTLLLNRRVLFKFLFWRSAKWCNNKNSLRPHPST